MTEPTPTLEEFGYSFLPTRWFDPTLENLFYWEVKASLTLGPLYARTFMLMRAGMTFEAAGYAATQNSYAIYRVMTRMKNVASFAANPFLMLGTVAIAAQYHTLTSPPPTEALRSEPGQTSWWRSVSQALVGTGPGVGSWTV